MAENKTSSLTTDLVEIFYGTIDHHHITHKKYMIVVLVRELKLKYRNFYIINNSFFLLKKYNVHLEVDKTFPIKPLDKSRRRKMRKSSPRDYNIIS